MTFDPVLPPVALAALAVVILALRAVVLRSATRSGRWGVLRWAATTGALMLVVLAAARPGVDAEPTADDAGANVFFVVDLSADSAIADVGGSTRMSAIREDIDALMAAHEGARFGVITFTSRPAVAWPLSGDAWSLRPLVDTLSPAVGPNAAADQANAAAAANVLRYQLIAARQRYPQAEELVYYFGSGAAQSTSPQSEFAAEAVDGGAVFGYDAGDGAARLRAISDQLGVPYVNRAAGDPVRAAETGSADAATIAESPPRTEYYWVLTSLASALLLIEIGLTVRDLRRTRLSDRAGR
ncbi:VWA domain-containing protein [Mycolicibacterium sp. OfavD-34-C]|uniref:VWA domain-containing protein n=1 Tax=Mycolicibacterium sp. OfavD-34-C TaxID=2917746 RepID=UPI001EF40D21|nr:VWA domain-containing protein [Mycolicibacterium sp. OfavD-34-C]MCG7578609.1 VWA domain-containing protein [Mycolicibacterium sp. OfavD-34-C]